MRQFIKTVVPTEGYTEIKQVGTKYVVHLEGVNHIDDGSTTCYECMTDNTPDIEQLRADLEEYKAYIAGKELESAKRQKVKELEVYDSSNAVNKFFYQGYPMWLDKATRAGLQLRITAEQAHGDTTTTLWFDTHSFEIPIANALQMLYDIELYASACYDRTAAHKAAINALDSVEAVEAYDFTVGYPERLIFEI